MARLERHHGEWERVDWEKGIFFAGSPCLSSQYHTECTLATIVLWQWVSITFSPAACMLSLPFAAWLCCDDWSLECDWHSEEIFMYHSFSEMLWLVHESSTALRQIQQQASAHIDHCDTSKQNFLRTLLESPSLLCSVSWDPEWVSHSTISYISSLLYNCGRLSKSPEPSMYTGRLVGFIRTSHRGYMKPDWWNDHW